MDFFQYTQDKHQCAVEQWAIRTTRGCLRTARAAFSRLKTREWQPDRAACTEPTIAALGRRQLSELDGWPFRVERSVLRVRREWQQPTFSATFRSLASCTLLLWARCHLAGLDSRGYHPWQPPTQQLAPPQPKDDFFFNPAEGRMFTRCILQAFVKMNQILMKNR